jgi:small nuclear ribonucleoprotein (snRNP)-like protein
MEPMTRVLAVLTALLLVTSVGWAAGNEVEGKIKSYDQTSNMLTLEDGTEISVPADVKVERDQLKAGASVKASFEDKDGKKTATSIEVK